MDTDAGVSLIIMYEDESVDVRYRDGTRLQLSSCGSEFLLEKPADPRGHPPQPTERVRQRTRFTVSAYKELVVAALEFRNNYASRPYLPEELISADKKKGFFFVEQCVQWPERSSFQAEDRPGGEIGIKSEEDRAALILSPSGETFSVEFTCSLSRDESQRPGLQCLDGTDSQTQACSLIFNSVEDCTKMLSQSRVSAKSDKTGKVTPAPEKMFQSATVVQHHSCSAFSPTWAYPLSLVRHHWMSHFSEDVEASDSSISTGTNRETSDMPCEERISQLPQALSLTCPLPHWHRWKVKDPLVRGKVSDIPTDLVKIVWCQGIIYRILSGTGIEICPGDGSVIRSTGISNSYFTHHKFDLQSKQAKKLTYHLNSLPPDVHGQMYSVCSVVNRANRILAIYNQAKQLLKFPASPSCLQESKKSYESGTLEKNPCSSVTVEQQMNVTHGADNRSCIVAAELEKITRFNFLLENSRVPKREDECAVFKDAFAEVTCEPVNDDCIAEALENTSKAIRDIDALMSATTRTYKGSIQGEMTDV
ncbi:uncharacterized protein C5orf34 homolog [Oryzias latipes]|uniref:uncharacterized protein C5orf34 homolog n=1 Tax=Oryzias latipes TaxID=8090 RepID=UPI0002A4BB36|nr:uncharacterized protein C5orf34 homolog [Oryzias latipes]